MTGTRPRTALNNSTTPQRKGHLAVGIAVGVTAILAAAGFMLPRGFMAHRMASTAALTSSAVATTELVPGALASWLGRVGLDPRSLAAAGVLPAQVTQIAADARSHLAEHVTSLDACRDAADAARSTVQVMEERVRSGLASPEEMSQLSAARAASVQAQSALDTAKAALATAATMSLSEAQRASLAALARNAGREVPLPYRLIDRDGRSWHALRNDLAHARVAARRGEASSTEVAQRLSEADGHPVVAAARANTNTNLAPVTIAWSDATR